MTDEPKEPTQQDTPAEGQEAQAEDRFAKNPDGTDNHHGFGRLGPES